MAFELHCCHFFWGLSTSSSRESKFILFFTRSCNIMTSKSVIDLLVREGFDVSSLHWPFKIGSYLRTSVSTAQCLCNYHLFLHFKAKNNLSPIRIANQRKTLLNALPAWRSMLKNLIDFIWSPVRWDMASLCLTFTCYVDKWCSSFSECFQAQDLLRKFL